jgi:hypothetical protein
MSKRTNEKIRKVIMKEIVSFLLFAIAMVAIYAIIAASLPVGIYWYWFNMTKLDSLYLFCYELIFGGIWISLIFCCCAARVKKSYFRRLNLLSKRVRSIHRRYEMSSMKIEDLK